jgi:ATP-dependent DNA ligase
VGAKAQPGLFLNGRDLRGLLLTERKQRLRKLL